MVSLTSDFTICAHFPSCTCYSLLFLKDRACEEVEYGVKESSGSEEDEIEEEKEDEEVEEEKRRHQATTEKEKVQSLHDQL